MAIGVDIQSLGYDIARDRYYIYADGEVFDSITQASEKCKIGRSAIQECLSGRNKTCSGVHWKYI